LEIGDIHPVLLHFSIVLFFIVFVLDFLLFIGKLQEPFSSVSHWIVIIAAVLALFTVITGLYAVELDHESNSYVFIHRNWALSTLAYSIVHVFFRGYVVWKKKVFSAYVFLFISLVNLTLISTTAEYGGFVARSKGLWMHYLFPKSTEHH
jgi:uncharacterized membrane protein